jgi:cytochrome c oxidase subunit 2
MGSAFSLERSMRLMIGILLGWLCISISVAARAADPVAGKAAYAVCSTCHGPDAAGSKALNAPRTAGQYGWYLKRQIQAFKDGVRGTAPGDIYGAQMRPMAMTLANEAAIDNVIAYIGTLTAPISPVTVTGDAVAGKQLYSTCAACHGPKGEGNTQLNAPRLADQNDWYLVRELQNFKSGVRGSDPKDLYGAQMKPMAAMLANDQAISNVVVYIRSMK